jgi:FkbM family methyltransferase
MHHISEMSYRRWVGVDEEIFLEQGILASATCTTPDSVETELIDWIRQYVKPGDVFYDIGANVGAYSLYVAKHHKGKVKVYAFEPAAVTIPLLIHNIVHNGCTGLIKPMTFPLSAKPALATFNYNMKMTPGFAQHSFGEAIDVQGKAFKPVFQEFLVSASLDQLVAEYHIDPPNHIKIDVDGLEQEILGGGANVLISGAVKSLFFEVGGRCDMPALASFLAGCGFRQQSAFQHDNTSNVIFVHESAASG